MSDSDGDIDDELLELAGQGTEKKRKRQAPGLKLSATKKRKSNSSSDSENEPESEEGEEGNPYPLEAKYEDEADRERLLAMSEIEREAILADRLERMQKIQDRRKLQEMIRQQKGASNDADRQHTVRGATKEKSKKLDELKAKRKAKDEKKRVRTDSPKRERSSSPMDMETSSGEEEDGQITKYEEEEERERRLYSKQSDPEDELATLADLVKCRLSRDMIAKYCMAPWFEDYVKGKYRQYIHPFSTVLRRVTNQYIDYVRSSVSADPVPMNSIQHTLQDLGANFVRPYKVNNRMVNQNLELRHGKSVKAFSMDKVSNAKFEPREFVRLTKTYAADGMKLPSKRQLEKKAAQIEKLVAQPFTESDVAAMLARKNQFNHQQSSAAITMERSRLMQAKTLALRRQDYPEVADIEAKLKELPVAQNTREEEESLADKLAKVNERNRKANLEAVRKAEFEAERKRRERKLAAAGLSGTATPEANARLKAVSRLPDSISRFVAVRWSCPVSPVVPCFSCSIYAICDDVNRSATPNISATATPVLNAQSTAAARPISPLPGSTLSALQTSPGKSLEASLIESIEVDLGDF
ncbi:hypothetical protein ID866_5310 [Astraeus odoratus]|nr:hypothetical protein ID866_5310 [Astraeus odoratus]